MQRSYVVYPPEAPRPPTAEDFAEVGLQLLFVGGADW